MKISTITVARFLLIISVAFGLFSWWQTIIHVGDESYTFLNYKNGKYHAWVHAFRESFYDIGIMTIFVLILFGKRDWRTVSTWKIAFVLMFFYYVPSWVGGLFYPQLKFPNMTATAVHLAMIMPAFLALFISKKEFYK